MLLVVPGPDDEPWPTIGAQVCDFIESVGIYGPGSLQGQPYVIDPEFRAFLFRASEVYPRLVTRSLAGSGAGGPGLRAKDPHPWAGRRRFKRVGLSVRKGLAKTEKEALVVLAHVHPDGPGRCDGFDASDSPVAAPVRAPYVPMLAYTKDQVEELAFGALKYIVENGPDADLFDVSLERILRLDDRGRADGGAWPLAAAPNARDGARTTLNAFDEPHRLYSKRHLEAHRVMDANLPKRPLDDPWSLYVGTAGELGQGSVAEELHVEAEQISRGEIERPDLFYLYRTDDGNHDLTKKAERVVAIREATGPAGEWGPGQFDDIASKWDRPRADTAYLERVWLNRWVKSSQQAYNPVRWAQLKHIDGDPEKGLRPVIQPGSLVTAGFDGARFRDSTGIVITEVLTGTQQVWGVWERPADLPDDAPWEVSPLEVNDSVEALMSRMQVWRMLCDPPYWIDSVAGWHAKWPGVVEEWWTNRPRQIALAARSYGQAQRSGAVGWPDAHPLSGRFADHVTGTGKNSLNLYDEDEDDGTPGARLWMPQKIHESRKIDLTMCGILSWIARLEAVKAGARPAVPTRPRRIR